MYTAMIVDDEFPARNMLDLLINWRDFGFEVIAKAENGKQALSIYKEKRPDLIITDIQMPVMDGIRLIEEIRFLEKNPFIVVLSCHESFQYAQQAIRLGVKDYLIKDMVTGEQLKSCLLQVIEQKTDSGTASEASSETSSRTGLLVQRQPDEKLAQAYPGYLTKAESRLASFQNSLMSHNYKEAQRLIGKIYQIPFDGLVKYHYLRWVNKYIYKILSGHCRKNGIPAELIFENSALLEDSFLLEIENTDTICDMLYQYISRIEKENTLQETYSFRVQNIIQYIQNNYYQDISLQSVASHFGIHKVYLARQFKAETGETLNEFLNKTRIEKAKLLLVITENTANDIAYTVGFNNTQSFYTMFKKYTGESPNEYRRKQHADIT